MTTGALGDGATRDTSSNANLYVAEFLPNTMMALVAERCSGSFVARYALTIGLDTWLNGGSSTDNVW